MVHRMEKMYIIECALCDDANGRSQLIVDTRYLCECVRAVRAHDPVF